MPLKLSPLDILALDLRTAQEIEGACSQTVTKMYEKTRDLISEKEFKMMKDGVRIINVARGGVINEEALENAILSDKVTAAALDVLRISLGFSYTLPPVESLWDFAFSWNSPGVSTAALNLP